ncbi:MAG: B12-binding domain-containing radical SAM protein [Nanoarchaeota archaeon]
MKFMIIAPPNDLDATNNESTSYDNRITPLDIAYIGAVLEGSHQVRILDALALALNKNQIIDEIAKFNPDIICLTAFDRCRWGIDSSNKLVRLIKNKKRIIGLIWTYNSDLLSEILENNKDYDFAVFGDPEFTLLDVANKKSFRDIKGLVYRNKDKVIKNKPRELIKDLDELPFPARHLLDLQIYKRMPHESLIEPNFDIAVTRGCPFNCTFCLLKVTSGKNRRTRSPEKAVEEVEILKRMGARQVHFQDPVLTLNKEWSEKFCNLLIEKNFGVIWSCQTRVDCIDEKLLKLMKKAGCRSILYGIESLDQNILDNIKKGVKVEDIIRIIKITKQIGIETRCSLMLGLPGETKESFEAILDKLIKLSPAFAQFHATVAFPGTELFENFDKFGRLAEDKHVKKFDLTGKPFIPNGYNNEQEILATQRHAYKKFYIRPFFVLKKIFNFKDIERNIRGIKIILKLQRNSDR